MRCIKFLHSCLSSDNLIISNVVIALHTKASKFLGSNHLGRSLMALRDKVQIMDPISIDDITFRFSTPPESPKPINKVSGSDMASGSETTGNAMDPQSSEPSGDTVQDLSSLNSTENMDTTTAPNISNDDSVSENPSGDTPQPDAIPPPSEYSDNDTSTTPVTTDTSTSPVTTDTSTTPVTTDTSTTPVTTDTSATHVTTDTSATPVITETPTPIATTSNVHSNTGKITPKENTDADDDVLPPPPPPPPHAVLHYGPQAAHSTASQIQIIEQET